MVQWFVHLFLKAVHSYLRHISVLSSAS